MCTLCEWAIEKGADSPPTKGNQKFSMEGEKNLEKAQRKSFSNSLW